MTDFSRKLVCSEKGEGKKGISRVPGEPRGWKKPQRWENAKGVWGHLLSLWGEGSATKLLFLLLARKK